MSESVELVKKLSTKTIIEKDLTDIFVENNMKPMDLFTLVGRANNLRDGSGDNGSWTALVGEFEAVRLSDGVIFAGAQAFIPGPAGEMLVQQVRNFITEEIPVDSEEFKKKGKTYKTTGDTVELALVIGIKRATRPGGRPYEFTNKPLVEVRKADALAALREKALAHIAERKALAAPAAAPIPAPAAPIPAPAAAPAEEKGAAKPKK